jgi:hypothetical protein
MVVIKEKIKILSSQRFVLSNRKLTLVFRDATTCVANQELLKPL